MSNLTGSRSSFPNAYDQIVELFDLPPAKIVDAVRYKELKAKANKTQLEIDELNALTLSLGEYISTPEKMNKIGDIIVKMQEFIYERITDYYAFKGAYSAGTSYETFNTVVYDSSTYLALQQSTGILPTNTTYWLEIGGQGPIGQTGPAGADLSFLGEYDPGYTYYQNYAVHYEGLLYYAKQTTLGNLPTNATYWGVFLDLSGITDFSPITVEPVHPYVGQLTFWEV